MAFNFTTGPTLVPDIGQLSYNGCTFSPYFESAVSGRIVQDDAKRTTKCAEYTITADGYVTPPASTTTYPPGVSPTMLQMQKMLTGQGGYLRYTGRTLDLIVNPTGVGTGLVDVAWGPIPELIEFQPMGGGMCAKVKWRVKTQVPVVPRTGFLNQPELQFNYETVVSYGEDGYSTLSVRGTLEIPLTRLRQTQRTITRSVGSQTVDDLRQDIERRIMSGIDLTRFRMVRRDFPVTRDKRTMEWDFSAEELPYMNVPPYCTIARGTYDVKPAQSGMGLCNWLCSLQVTYIPRGDAPRRVAWWAFLALLRVRMLQSQFGYIPTTAAGNQNPTVPNASGGGFMAGFLSVITAPPIGSANFSAGFYDGLLGKYNKSVGQSKRAMLIDFTVSEGTHLDSKWTRFSAAWRVVTTFSHIMLASGLWKKVPEVDGQGNNVWAASVRDVMGSQSWLPNKLNPVLDVIVDFGGG